MDAMIPPLPHLMHKQVYADQQWYYLALGTIKIFQHSSWNTNYYIQTISWVVLQQYLFYEWTGMSYLSSSHINNMVSLKCSATFCNDQFDSWQYDRSNTEAQLNIYIIIYTYTRIHLLSLFRSGEFLHSSWLEHNVFRHICI